jgi:hypothetical protein
MAWAGQAVYWAPRRRRRSSERRVDIHLLVRRLQLLVGVEVGRRRSGENPRRQWLRLRHHQRRGWFGLGTRWPSAITTTAADAHVEATFSKPAESAETAEITRRPEEVVATATSTMTTATATSTVAAATRDETAPMAIQTKKMAEQTKESSGRHSYLFVLLLSFLFLRRSPELAFALVGRNSC